MLKSLITILGATLLSLCISNAQEAVDTIQCNDSTLVLADTALSSIIDTNSCQSDSTITPACDSAYSPASDSLAETKIIDTLSIVMVGDVMLGTNYPSTQYLPPASNCHPLLNPVANYVKEGDIRFCNLEGVFAGDEGTPKNCRNPKNCYVFRMPDTFLDCITETGFNLISVANNHVNDFGYGGRVHESKLLDEAGIAYAGFVSKPYTIFENKGYTIGFCAFSPNTGVMDIRNTKKALEIVTLLNDTCDIVIVSMHGGAEGSNHQHVTREKEIFLGADRGNVYAFAHNMIDAGADVIIGHGPHVTRAMEIYNKRFIAYSLGNFATYARFNISGPNGIAPLVNIQVTSKGEFLGGKVIPTRQLGQGGAKYDPGKRVIFKLQELMQSDFPNSLLQVNDEGELIYKTE